MQGWSIGVVVIRERITQGIFHTKTKYKGRLHNASLSGFSINEEFKNVYHRGDKVKARYRMLTADSGRNKGEEYIEFEVLE